MKALPTPLRPPAIRFAHVALFSAAVLLAGLLVGRAHANELEQVLANLQASAESLIDASFVLEGVLIDEAGQVFRLEIEVLALPTIPAVGLYILRPDAIADNMIVLDGDVVRSYTFITHQTTLFDLDDPDAFGGLIGVDENGDLPVSLDLAQVFADWDARVEGPQATPRGPGLLLRFDNRDPESDIGHVLAVVVEGAWEPWQLQFFLRTGNLFADLTFRDFTRDQGLTREEVVYLPEDAEILDRRRR
jgi:outer membrane lipoprotein-sorting protein